MIFVCVAGGPSLTREDVEYCRGKAAVIVVNDGYRMAPWADYLYAADHRWWISTPNGEAEPNWRLSARTFRGERLTTDKGTADMFGLGYIPHQPGRGLAKPPFIHGTNGGIEAVSIAALKGARRILLLGYDMGATGSGHWFGDHPDAVTLPDGRVERLTTMDAHEFALARGEFAALAIDLDAAGIEVINCTRTTALECFPRKPIQECL